MATVTFYTNNDEGGTSSSYSGAQGRASGVMGGIDSLVTGSNTWLVVYNQTNYKGDYLKVGPSTTKDDLNHVDRSSGGDWKNQIASFVMYGSQPSWWNGTPDPSVVLASHQVIFAEDESYSGDNRVFTGEITENDLNNVKYSTNSSRDMKNNITSLKTGPNAWLQIWDSTDCSGNYKQIYPNTSYPDLNNVSRMGGGDWKNQIQSFQVYNSLPSSWVLGFDESTFNSSFPGYYNTSDLDGAYIKYKTQDADYDIHLLGVTYPDTATMQISLKICYDIPMGTNDKVYLDILVNPDGSLNGVTYSYDAGSALQVPPAVVKAVDVGVEVAGAVGALESAGISEAAAQEFVETFDTICKVFDKVANAVFKLSQNDDGRFYLVPVACLAINRALLAVTVSN